MVIVVSAIILGENDQIVLIQEGKPHNLGKWNIPSGRLKIGEDLICGIEREIKEETGLNVIVKSLTGIYKYKSSTGRDCIRFNFICEAINYNLIIDHQEILNIKWVSQDEININSDFWNPHSLRVIFEDFFNNKSYNLDIIKNIY